jgi:hypothetical protein
MYVRLYIMGSVFKTDLESAIEGLAGAADGPGESEHVAEKRDAEQWLIDRPEELAAVELREEDVKQATKHRKAIEQAAVWVPAHDVVLVRWERCVLDDAERAHVVGELQHERAPDHLLKVCAVVEWQRKRAHHQGHERRDAARQKQACQAVALHCGSGTRLQQERGTTDTAADRYASNDNKNEKRGHDTDTRIKGGAPRGGAPTCPTRSIWVGVHMHMQRHIVLKSKRIREHTARTCPRRIWQHTPAAQSR